MRISDFLGTLGINTHVNSYPYDDTKRITTALDYIGFKNVRQSSPIDQASFAGTEALGKAGFRIDLIVNGGGPVSLPGAMLNVNLLAPYLNAVENVNEVAIFPISYAGRTGVDAAVVLQRDLYAAVRSNPALNSASVYSFTIGGADPAAYPSIGDISAYTDYANIHAYPPHGLRPIFVIHAAIDGGRTDAPSKPVVLTETGFYTLTNGVGWGGVPESVQARYLLSEVLDEAGAGVSRTYLYDLLDDGPDPNGTNQEAHFGLFYEDGSPKLAATAFHNLTTLLADTGPAAATFTPSTFGFTASGVPYDYTGNTLLLDKSDGSHTIAVWNEQQTWDPETKTTSAAQHFPVTVSLDRSYHTVLVFDPLVGTAPVQTLHDVGSVALDLTDHPFLVQVLPDAPAATPVPAPSTPAPTAPVVTPVAPAPGHTVVVRVSEDAYLGDGQFQLTVDGAPVGGVLTAVASHAAGRTQDITLTMPASVTPGRVGVTFLNDAYGGSASTDRNLYIDSVTTDGVDLPGSARTLLCSGTAEVNFGAATPTAVTFDLSEDAWQGDAVAVLAIDGNQIGNAVTITALHALGQDQRMQFMVPLAAGPHTATVTFVNDAWGGTPQTDRNLYVNAVEIGGTVIPYSTAALYGNSAASFASAFSRQAMGTDLISVGLGGPHPV